jgi:hypothetical protein
LPSFSLQRSLPNCLDPVLVVRKRRQTDVNNASEPSGQSTCDLTSVKRPKRVVRKPLLPRNSTFDWADDRDEATEHETGSPQTDSSKTSTQVEGCSSQQETDGHKCTECQRSFSTAKGLVIHKRSHSRKTCPGCGTQFKGLSFYELHAVFCTRRSRKWSFAKNAYFQHSEDRLYLQTHARRSDHL